MALGQAQTYALRRHRWPSWPRARQAAHAVGMADLCLGYSNEQTPFCPQCVAAADVAKNAKVGKQQRAETRSVSASGRAMLTQCPSVLSDADASNRLLHNVLSALIDPTGGICVVDKEAAAEFREKAHPFLEVRRGRDRQRHVDVLRHHLTLQSR